MCVNTISMVTVVSQTKGQQFTLSVAERKGEEPEHLVLENQTKKQKSRTTTIQYGQSLDPGQFFQRTLRFYSCYIILSYLNSDIHST